VVGSQARILYSNEEGRTSIALAFNKAVADGRLKVRLFSQLVVSSSPSSICTIQPIRELQLVNRNWKCLIASY